MTNTSTVGKTFLSSSETKIHILEKFQTIQVLSILPDFADFGLNSDFRTKVVSKWSDFSLKV